MSLFRPGTLGVLTLALLLNPAYSTSCPTGGDHANTTSATQTQSYWRRFSKSPPKHARKPADAGGWGALPSEKNHPWGGDGSRWKPEAILANAVSEALNDGFAQAGVRDVLVAIPVRMQPGKGPANRPYGDGQTNALVSLGDNWNQKQPPLVASLLLFQNGGVKIKLRFHRSLSFGAEPSIEIAYVASSGTRSGKLGPVTRSADGDYETEWAPSAQEMPAWGTMFQNQVAFVRPTGWKDWFPIDFRNVVLSNSQLLDTVPAEKRRYARGTLLDPERVSVQGLNTVEFPFQKIGAPGFAQDVVAQRYIPINPPGIHDKFYQDNGALIPTAVGNGSTLVFPNAQMDPPGNAPMKMAYICFEPRNEAAERAAGLPSGGGWHEIGDPAETVINSLENAPLVIGYANGKPAGNPPTGQFAYGLTDVSVMRKVFPGNAIVTTAGPTTLQEGYGPSRGRGPLEGRNYHWFFFDHSHYVCAREWVHNCVPTPYNQLGQNCAR
jgi:hypothetical protein